MPKIKLFGGKRPTVLSEKQTARRHSGRTKRKQPSGCFGRENGHLCRDKKATPSVGANHAKKQKEKEKRKISVEATGEIRKAGRSRHGYPRNACGGNTGKAEESGQSNHAFLEMRSKGKALKENAVIIRVLAICTVLGATTALKNGLLLAAAAFLVTIPLYLIMALLKKVPMFVYFSAALLIAGALETPVIMLASHFFPEVTLSCSYFLPITAVNAVLMLDLHALRGKRSLIRSLEPVWGMCWDIPWC